MSSQRYLNGRSATVSREVGIEAASAGLVDEHGDLDTGCPEMAIGIADVQPTTSIMDEREGEAESRIVPDAAARKDHQSLTYPGEPPQAPDRNPTKLDQPYRRVVADMMTRSRKHLDVLEPTSNAPGKSPDGSPSAEGISAFLGRVLDQLSLSAWLPAAMLVGSLSVLLQLHAQRNRDVAKAATNLVNKPLGLLVVLLFALVLATMITQAFEFEVIRLLEGYWGNRRFSRGILHLSVHRQERKFYRLLRQRDELTLRAFREAKLIENGIVPAGKRYIVDLIEGELADGGAEARGWREKRRAREAQKYKETWRQFAPPNLMSRLEAVESQIHEYPQPYRMLPTKLGNVIRAVEDSIPAAQGDDLESFVIRQWDDIPSGLRKEHDQYRGRLDLYCTLMFVFFVLAIIAAPLITYGSRYLIATIVTSAAYLSLSLVSYAAAIASARGYGTALKAIADMNNTGKARSRTRA